MSFAKPENCPFLMIFPLEISWNIARRCASTISYYRYGYMQMIFYVHYRICPYTCQCPNRHACPCSKKHITSNMYQMPDKSSKDHPKTLKFEWSVWLPHMWKLPLPCKQRSTLFVFTVYMSIVGTGRQALLLKLIDVHPSPCTRALRFY